MSLLPPVFKTDLEYIFSKTEKVSRDLTKANILITGGTGFFGKWLLQALLFLNETQHLNLILHVLTRDPEKFLQQNAYLHSNKVINFIKGDINNPADMTLLADLEFTHIIHAATAADATLNKVYPTTMFNTIVQGSRVLYDLASQQTIKPNILFLSSGAVYGAHAGVQYLSETLDQFLPSTTDAYASGKRAAETMCSLYANEFGIPIKIARCFAFLGPYLPLNTHFAIGNFINDALHNKPIVIKGTGNTVFRSYQYMADLVIWLLHILLKGETCRPYNVGSQQAYSILDIARLVIETSGKNLTLDILGDGKNSGVQNYYVPNVERASNELNLTAGFSLEKSLHSTLKWYQNSGEYND